MLFNANEKITDMIPLKAARFCPQCDMCYAFSDKTQHGCPSCGNKYTVSVNEIWFRKQQKEEKQYDTQDTSDFAGLRSINHNRSCLYTAKQNDNPYTDRDCQYIDLHKVTINRDKVTKNCRSNKLSIEANRTFSRIFDCAHEYRKFWQDKLNIFQRI